MHNTRTRVSRERGTENDSENGEKHSDLSTRTRWKNRAEMALLIAVCIISSAILLAMASNGLHK